MSMVKKGTVDSGVDVVVTCTYKCSSCGHEEESVNPSETTKFCPSCGEKMKVVCSTSS